jgi:hypothetical protein
VSKDLRQAADSRIPNEKASIVLALQKNSPDFASKIFSTKTLQEQMTHFLKRYHDTEEHLESTCDIEELIHYDLLDQAGGRSFCEHTGGALTSLGILGTFFGLVTGLSGFAGSGAENEVDQITAGIQQLLGGMTVAFWTSIIGIIGSILFGVLYRTSFQNAYSNLDAFLRQFRSEIANTHSGSDRSLLLMQESLKDLPHSLRGIGTLLRRISDAVGSMNEEIGGLNEMLSGFDGEARMEEIRELTASFTDSLQADMHSVMEQLTEQVSRYTAGMQSQCDAVRELTGSMTDTAAEQGHIAEQLRSVGGQYGEFLDTVARANSDVLDGFALIRSAAQENMRIAQQEQQLLQSSMEAIRQSRDMVGGINDSADELLRQLMGSVSSANNQLVERINSFNDYMQDCSEAYLQNTTSYLETALALLSEGSNEDMTALKADMQEELRRHDETFKKLHSGTNDLLSINETQALQLTEIRNMMRQQAEMMTSVDSRLKALEKQVQAGGHRSLPDLFRRGS